MCRRVCLVGAFAILGIVPALWAQDADKDKPQQKPASPAERYSSLLNEYQKAQREYIQALNQAKTVSERQAAAKSAPRPADFASRFLAIAQEHPKDPVAVDALIWVVNTGRGSPESQKALKSLVTDHLGSEKIAQVAVAISALPDGEATLRTILAKNQHEAVRGSARYALARTLISRSFREGETAEAVTKLRSEAGTLLGEVLESSTNAKGPETPMTDQVLGLLPYAPNGADPIRRTLEKELPHDLKGKLTLGLSQVVKKQSEEAETLQQAVKLSTEAETLLQEVIDNFADVRGTRGSLADTAKTQLTELRTFGVGKVAPDIEGEDVDGTKFKLSDYRGKVVFLDFWGHW
jgi:hypothetical protein